MKNILLLLSVLLIGTGSSFSQLITFDDQGHTNGLDIPNPYVIVNGAESFRFTSANGSNPQKYYTTDPFCSNSVGGHLSSGGYPSSSWTIETTSGAEINFGNVRFDNIFTCFVFTYNLTIEGFKNGSSTGTQSVAVSGINHTWTPNSNFDDVDRIVITEAGGDLGNLGIDNINWAFATPPCTDPTVPTITHTPATVCSGGTASLNISGTLNDATAWQVYTGSCGGTNIGSTTTGTFAIPGTINTPTTYFVRGEGSCVTPGSCGSVTITPTALDNASFNYSAATYCVNAADPTPTITGLGGGSFSSTPGLSINSSTGQIDVSASTPNTYTVTYTTAGTCPNSSNVSVTINGLDDPSFSYSASAFCVNAADPTPTITGLGGGSFSSTPGLSINSSTGQIDVSASTPNTYTVTYTTAGSCPNSSNVSVTINALDDPSFSYSASAYCVNAADPTPTITGVGGGSFSSTPGLSINSSTGQIDVSASTPNTYTVTYTTAGTCPNSSNVSVTINALDDASFNYSAASYCVNAADPTPTITGLPGGSFSGSPGGFNMSGSTGTIDLSASFPNTYTITYTTAGSCPNSSNVSVTVNSIDNAGFSYGASSYCVNGADPTPSISGTVGGTFSSTAGLSINSSTGVIDVSASMPNTYTVTYTTSGACSVSSDVSVTINSLDDASFNYASNYFCSNDADPTPTITGLAGGSFNSAPGGINISGSTGLIDLSASFPNTYTITYSTNGACPNSSDVIVSVAELSDFSVTPANPTICSGENTNIDLGSSQVGVKYILRDEANDTLVSGPLNGTGGVLLFNTGAITSDMSYNVYAETLNGNALNFTGNGGVQRVSLGTDLWTDNFVGTDQITVEAWVKRSSTGSLHTIIGNYQGAYPMLLRIDNDRINMFANSSISIQGGTVIPVGTWTHVAGTYDGSALKVYVNGVLDGQVPFSGNFIGTTNELKIGGGLTNNTEYFMGDIADVRLWNVAKSQAEISAGMNSLPLGNETGLIASYQFTEGVGITAANSAIGNAYPGTIINNPAWVAGPFPSGACALEMTDIASVTVNPVITGSYTAPADLCIDAGIQTGLGGGLPTGGVYSGAGVTDDGNGTTYSFDPASAGAGTHTITYTPAGSCVVAATDDIEVFVLTAVSFTALSDLCLDEGVQTGLGGGTPTGGVYSGVGVTDDGNGMTYSFDPAAAGAGTHTITYTFTNGNGCTSSANDDVEVFDVATGSFTALADVCIDAGVQTGLGGGLPTGGVYSGVGVTDDGNGMTYSFDPSTAGIGVHTITYTPAGGCSTSANDDVEVFGLPTVTFTAPSDVCPGSAVLTSQGNGMPTGGIYSGVGVTDDGNGTSYSFDPTAAGSGTHTITYTYTDVNSCMSAASDDITLEDNTAPVADAASLPTESAGCNVTLTPPTATDDCSGTVTGTTTTVFPINESTTVVWTFTDASGNSTTQTQEVVITPINTDIHVWMDDIQIFALNTDAGVTHQWYDCAGDSIIIGATNHFYEPTFNSEFAVIVTQNGCSDTSECVLIDAVGLIENEINEVRVYPNPSTGIFNIELSNISNNPRIELYSLAGTLVVEQRLQNTNSSIDISSFEKGVYYLRLLDDTGNITVTKLIKQ